MNEKHLMLPEMDAIKNRIFMTHALKGVSFDHFIPFTNIVYNFNAVKYIISMQ